MTPRLEADVAVTVGELSLSVSLSVDARGLLLVGPNGAGKTTLLLALLGALPGVRGSVTLDGRALADDAHGLALPPEARRLGYLPQDYALFPHLTAAENVAFALGCARPAPPRTLRRKRAREALAGLGVGAVADRLPAALSGGERQRVALARALAGSPGALLLDEPLAALDAETRAETRSFLRQALATMGRPYLLVTHDVADAAALEAPVAVLERGRIVQEGSLEALGRAPATPYVRRFLGL